MSESPSPGQANNERGERIDIERIPLPTAQEGEGTVPENMRSITFLKDVEVNVTVELGSTKLPVREILKLQRGSVVELDRLVGEPVDLLINNTLLAKGEVIVINERFGFRIMKFINPADDQ